MDFINKILGILDKGIQWVQNTSVYKFLESKYPDSVSTYVPFLYVFFALCVLVILVVVLIICLICKPKKRKITFHFTDEDFTVVKVVKGKKIRYPEIQYVEGIGFDGWFTEKECVNKFIDEKFKGKKDISLYAKFVKEGEEEIIEQEVSQEAAEPAVATTAAAVVLTEQPSEESVPTPNQVEVIVKEEAIPQPVVSDLADVYDELRHYILGFERVQPFAKFGVLRKQYIAQLFERDGKIYLYLAIDPDQMKALGYDVEKYTDEDFKVVPCKKVISKVEDYDEAVKLVDETMKFNLLVKSEYNFAKRVESDEFTRASGFSFFVKNETVATKAEDYYKILRSNILSYSVTKAAKLSGNFTNKVILKLFKNGEDVYLYLALDAEKAGLDFVGYDKAFADTPAMFAVKTAEDIFKANVLIDKVMFENELEKHPENAELDLSEQIENRCGFGYKIRY